MELGLFGIENGYLEAILRSLRLSLLKEENYAQIKSLTTLKDLQQYLEEETDYGNYFQLDQTEISVQTIKLCLKRKLAEEIEYIEKNAIAPLSQFLFFVRTSYMIDNLVNIVQGLRTNTPVERLEANADPLGFFPELKTIKVESDDLNSLYESVLIDTPISKYFLKFLEMNFNETSDMEQFKAFFKETNNENLRSCLKRLWLEDFNAFIQTLNPITRENMTRLLNFEADTKAVQVVYNSLEQSKSTAVPLRKLLLPAFGELYPDCHQSLIECDSFNQLKDAALLSMTVSELLKSCQDPQQAEEIEEAATLDDLIYEEEVKLNSLVFDEQCNFAAFYSYVKLKEQEIRNVVWMAEMIARKIPKENLLWTKYIVPFADTE